MKRMIMAGLILMTLTGGASGSIMAVGEPEVTNSWKQRFEVAWIGSFDHIQFRQVPDAGGYTASFETPTGITFFQGGTGDGTSLPSAERVGQWNSVFNNGTSLVAQGPDLTWLQFDLFFNGAMNQPVTINYQAYDGTSLKDNFDLSYHYDRVAFPMFGWGWSVQSSGMTQEYFVPEPSSLLLFVVVSGLFGKGLRRRTTLAAVK